MSPDGAEWDLERTARLPVVNLIPGKHPCTNTGKALPLSGATLERWKRWTSGEEELYACRRAVV